MNNDPVQIIKDDHEVVESLFTEYEALDTEEREEKQRIVDELTQELTAHAEMEETVCYPRFMKAFANEDDKKIDEAYAEHDVVKTILGELESLTPEESQFDAKVTVLMEAVRHHVEEEEGEILPQVEKEMSEEELMAMGEEMVAFKEAHGSTLSAAMDDSDQ